MALGFFDGVHVGHGALLRRTHEIAESLRLPSVALTFDIHPDQLLHGQPPPLLSTPEERERIMRAQYGMDGVMVLPFTPYIMRLPWDAFVQEVLVNRYEARHLIVGYNYRFGYCGEGTAGRLAAFCQNIGIGCDVLPSVVVEGIPVSSTVIRKLAAQGDTHRARYFLGHDYPLSGMANAAPSPN
jgi:riboflavin kinase/FMN adenylyltransferase